MPVVHESSVGDRIHLRLEDLTPAERKVARALLASFPVLALRSASVIAAESGTSPATVIRFANKLGYDGLPAFHSAVRSELQGSKESPFTLFQAPGDGVSPSVTAAESMLALITDALHRLTPEKMQKAADLILESRRVWVHGGRFSHGVAYTLFAHLNMLRPDVHLLTAIPTPIADQIAHAGREELAIVIDFRRYDTTAEFVAAHFAASRGRVIAVTDPYLSPAAQHADLTFLVPVEGFGLVDSYAGALAVLDLLVANLVANNEQLMAHRSVTLEEVRRLAETIAMEAKAAGQHAI